MTVGQLLTNAAARLRAAGIGSAPMEAQLLLAHVLKRDRVWLAVNRDRAVPARDCERFARFVKHRSSRIPLQYILGETEFYGYTIFVSKHTLIPRPETELLVEQVIRLWRPEYLTILDIGTGSGCIAVALAKELPQARITATDISARALAVASKNIAHHGLGGRITLVKADLVPGKRTAFDVIVSNPPYIPSRQIAGLQPEVSRFEPVAALDGGHDGLGFFRRITELIGSVINPGGMAALEAGAGQAAEVGGLLLRALPGGRVEVIKDYSGSDRVVAIQAGPSGSMR